MANARSCPMVVWWLYVMACKGDILYVGISPDPLRRFLDHQRGKSGFSRMRQPIALVACLPIGPHRLAANQERWLKRQPLRTKHEWIAKVRQSPAWQRLVEANGSAAFIAIAAAKEANPTIRAHSSS